MSLRWRKTGELLCGAKSKLEKDDTYIDDRLHYELSAIQKTIVPDKNEDDNGLWYWLHGWCDTAEHPQDVRDAPLIQSRRPPKRID